MGHYMTTPDPTVFERCAIAAWERNREACKGVIDLPPWDEETEGLRSDWRDLTRAVLTALRDHTGSSYTMDEVTRVLGEGE